MLSHECIENTVRSLWMHIATPNNATDYTPTRSTEIYQTLKPPFPHSHPQTRTFPQHLVPYMRLPEDDLARSRRPCTHIMHFAYTMFQFAFHLVANQHHVFQSRFIPS